MDDERGLNDFATQLQQDIISIAEVEGGESLRADAFTQRMIEELTEVGEIEDGIACYHRARGVEVSGYHVDDDGTLNLFTTIYTSSVPPMTVARSEVDAAVRRLMGFLTRAREGYFKVLEEASPVFDMAQFIYECRHDLARVRLFLFTDGLTTVEVKPEETVDDLPISFHLWDIRRLYRSVSSGQHREPIQIDFVARFGAPLPCLESADGTGDYAAYLCVIPGDILGALYAEFGSRLLELNVRSFLQARGRVNQGIRRTIIEAPGRFLAYNNGISATASQIELVPLPEGGLGIRALSDLQVVNGGQTTASLYHASRKDHADLSSVRVQAKISVVSPADVGSLVPLISRYANSQNRVSEADFSANDPFHVRLEALSRTVWAPPADGTQRQTRWFYERARGQYQDAVAREGTPARQRQFRAINPTPQRFTKTDVAKFEMTWDELPHMVSLGAQKCFTQFTLRLAKRGSFEPDQAYFERLIGKAILFRQTEKHVSMMRFGGYRANIVTYTLAYLCHRTAQRIDLECIWQRQSLGLALQETIQTVAQQVHEVIVSPPGGKNVTEWCKRVECWKRIQDLNIDLPEALASELVPEGDAYTSRVDRGIDTPTPEEQQQIAEAAAIPAETWLQVSRWAKETANLQGWQRGLAYSLGRLLQQGRSPSRKQAARGLELLKEARRLGFRSQPTEEVAS